MVAGVRLMPVSVSIQLQSRDPGPRYQVALGYPRCPHPRVRVDHQVGPLVPSWPEED